MISTESAQLALQQGNGWVEGFISGVVATVIGFFLSIAWDLYKYRRDSKKRDDAVLSAVNEELVANVFICESNKNAIQQELKFLTEGKSLVDPIVLLQNSTWDLIKINFPERLVKEKELLVKIRSLTQIIDHTNESIRSRENYRINNGAMSNYESRLKKYNNTILKNIIDILSRLESLKTELDKLVSKIK